MGRRAPLRDDVSGSDSVSEGSGRNLGELHHAEQCPRIVEVIGGSSVSAASNVMVKPKSSDSARSIPAIC